MDFCRLKKSKKEVNKFMSYIELDNIIYSIQKYGGISTYWSELNSRLDKHIEGPIIRSSGSKYMRLYSPYSEAKIFHSSHFRTSSNRSTKNVVTIHDLIYEKGLIKGPGKYINLYERRKALISADAIITISHSTLNDMKEFYGKLVESKPTFVIHHGCNIPLIDSTDQDISNIDLDQNLESKLKSGLFFMFVGSRTGYKNFTTLLDAYLEGNFHHSGIVLICTGSKFNNNEKKLIEMRKLEQFVFSVGLVDKITLNFLYSRSISLVYPSLYEGFGLPPLEAMAAGCPVICTNSSSLPEVIGNAGELVSPSSVSELAESMSKVINNEVRNSLIKKGFERAKIFNWENCIKKHVDVYSYLVSP